MVSHGGDVNYKVGEDLFLTAGDNTYNSNTKSSTATAGFWVGTNGLKDSGGLNITGVSGNVGGGKSKSSTNDLTWTSGYTQAEQGTIRFDVGNDMRAEGYTAVGKHIDVNVGGDLDLISKQNSQTSSGKGWNVSAGLGTGSISGGFGKNKSSEDRLWTDDISGFVGSESVNVDVGGKLNLEGSVIANIKDDGSDGGNLNVVANELTFKDLDDYSKSSKNHFGVSTVIGDPLQEHSDYPLGTTTITAVDKGHELTGVTRATIGQGDITLKDGTNPDELGINRDINKIQEITGDKVTGALDFEVTIDHRIFTKEGRESIGGDFANLPENIQTVALAAARLPKESFTKIMISTGLNKEQAEGIWNDIQTHSGTMDINPFDHIRENPEVLTQVEDLMNSPSYPYVVGTLKVGGLALAIVYGDPVTKVISGDALIAMIGTAVTGEEQKTVGSRIIVELTGTTQEKADLLYDIIAIGAGLGSGLKALGKAGSVVDDVAGMTGKATHFTSVERNIINEANGILSSNAIKELQTAHLLGKPTTINVNGRLIQYEPNLPASGMTMFGENGFLIGREAFTSTSELQKTILHELYRLNTSASKIGGVSSSLAKIETEAAFDFAERASKLFNK